MDEPSASLRCDLCGATAVTVHALPHGDAPTQLVVACDRHDPGGDSWRLDFPDDLASLLVSPALDALRPDVAAALSLTPPRSSVTQGLDAAAGMRSQEMGGGPSSAFADPARDPQTPEYALRAGYWCAAWTVIFPVLVLPALAFGFLGAHRGRLGAGVVLMILSGITLWINVIVVLALTGNLGGSSS